MESIKGAEYIFWKKIFCLLSSNTSKYTANRDNLVSITTGYRMYDRSLITGIGTAFTARRVYYDFGPHPAFYPVSCGPFSPEVERHKREGNRSLPSGTEINNSWICVSHSPHGMVWYLIKHKKNVT